jgi:hypothetical protein
MTEVNAGSRLYGHLYKLMGFTSGPKRVNNWEIQKCITVNPMVYTLCCSTVQDISQKGQDNSTDITHEG